MIDAPSPQIPGNTLQTSGKQEILAIFAVTTDFLAKTFFILRESPYLCSPQ
jgi:hypothetical protein